MHVYVFLLILVILYAMMLHSCSVQMMFVVKQNDKKDWTGLHRHGHICCQHHATKTVSNVASVVVFQ